jgi:hypothetical protein
MDEDEILEAIDTNLTGPAEVEGDAGRVRQHSLKDQLEYARYVAGRDAAALGSGRGLRFTKLVPPGTTS